MFNKIKEYAGLVAIVLFIASFLVPGSPTQKLGNATASYVDATLGFRVNGTEVISSSAVVDATVSSTALAANSLTLSSGTPQTKYLCAIATWNPTSTGPYIASTSTVSTDIALTGAVMGDTCVGSLTSATSSGLDVSCVISGTATATINLYNVSGVAIDPATGTAKVCFTH